MSIFNRNFGCEFEFSSNFEDVESAIKPIIHQIYGKNKLKSKKAYYMSVKNSIWHLKTDSSTACELVSPISSIKDIHKITKVIHELKRQKLSITTNDSFHVHIHAPDIDPQKIVMAWLEIEDFIIKKFAKHRWKNYYCEKLNMRSGKKYHNIASVFFDAISRAQEHHAAMSLYHYKKRKTVEFRISHGTFDTNLIESWILFCMHFLHYAKKMNIVEQMAKKTNDLNEVFDFSSKMHIKNRKIIDFLSREDGKK